MRTRIQVLTVTTAALLAAPAWLQAQTSRDDTMREFDRIVATMADATPQQAETAAKQIFDEAYLRGHQAKDFELAVHGFGAANSIPNLSEAMHEQLSFWQGFDLMQQAIGLQGAQTVESAQVSLPMFQEADGLVASSGGYPERINIQIDRVRSTIAQYIEIQQAIIRRGR